MKIIDYSSKYSEIVKNLFVELQEYISEIDREKYSILTSQFGEKYLKKTMELVNKFEGKIFLALDRMEVVGVIVGLINNEDETTYDFTAPKRGRITDLVVSKNNRQKGIGKQLLNKMENYFKSVGCKDILIDIIAYNESARKFYYKNGYFDRHVEVMKKI